MSLTIAILGATGRIGSAVAREAESRGHEVIAISRSGKAPMVGPSAIHRAADAKDSKALATAIDGAQVVFNGLNPVYTAWQRDNVAMARAVVEACRATGAHHLFPGNVYNVGSPMPPVIRSDSPQSATTRKGRVRIEMEKLLEDAARNDGPSTTIVRAGDYFGGPVAGSWLDEAFTTKLAKGKVFHPGSKNLAHAWAYLPDFSRALVSVAEHHEALSGFQTLGFAGHTATGQDIHDAIENATGQTLKTARLPWWLLRLMGLVHPMSREVSEMGYLWQEPHRIDGTELEKLIGPFEPTPLDEAVASALADLNLA